MSRVLITGSAGFIGGYVVQELLRRGHEVIGVDNLSKYGPVARSYDHAEGFQFVEGDARDVELLTRLLAGCDHLIAGAAMIGGISYFHAYAYDLLATNERIMAATCDAAIEAHRRHHLQKVTYMSSSMVYEFGRTRGRRKRARSTVFRHPTRPTASRSWRSSTSPERHTTSTAFRSPSSARSTASASVRGAPSATSRSPAATSSWP